MELGMTSWKESITDALTEAGETWKDVVANTMNAPEMATVFHDGYGGTKGIPFTLWTTKRVYFPICYDGSEWVGSAPRNPCEEKLEHQGG